MDVIVFILAFVPVVVANCDKGTGPSGITECFQSTRYHNKYQWGTCLTDAYIQTKTNRKYHCTDRAATYCYYQCMIEVHGIASGPVYNDCACQDGEEFGVSNLTLPTLCYSPSGTTCDWYRDCLERRYKCSGTEDDYGMAFATKFCTLYEKHYNRFSLGGKDWVDAVRKCLQVSLVPTLRPWRSLSCKDIKKIAFSSHVPCYVQPNDQSSGISICNLGAKDFFEVFWTVKSSLVMSVDSSLETVKGFWNTMKDCSSNVFERFSFDGPIRNLRLKMNYQGFDNSKFATFAKLVEKYATLLNGMVDDMADDLKWEEQGVIWYSDVDTNLSIISTDEMFVNIFIADRNMYDLNAPSSTTANLNSTVTAFQTKLETGGINVNTGGFTFRVLSAEGCADAECENTLFEVATKTVEKDKPKTMPYIIIGICFLVFLFLLAVVSAICFSRWKHGFGKGVV